MADPQDSADLLNDLDGAPPPDDATPPEPIDRPELSPDGPPAPVAAAPETPNYGELTAKIALAEERSRRFEQELEFVRSAQQQAAAPPPPAQPDPLATIQSALQVNEDDLAELLAGGPRAATIATAALQRAAALGAHVALQQAATFYTQDQARQQQTIASHQQAERYRQDFWSEHKDLTDPRFTPIVQHFAREVAAEQPERRFSWEAARTEVARRAREHLTGLGITPTAAAGTAPLQARRTLRPAGGEMGGRGGRSGQNGSSAFDRMFGDMALQ